MAPTALGIAVLCPAIIGAVVGIVVAMVNFIIVACVSVVIVILVHIVIMVLHVHGNSCKMCCNCRR